MPKKYNYYAIDAGFFNVQIKLCFDNKEFQKVLTDHNFNFKIDALDIGVAETHYVSDGRDGIIVIVFDLEACGTEPALLANIVAHEATHCVCRIFEHIGEEPDEIGEESRAYLTGHIVEQLTLGIVMEKEKNARKRNRTALSKKGQGSGGPKLQVDSNGDGGAGQNSVPAQKGVPSGAQDPVGGVVGTTKSGVQGSRKPRVSGDYYSK